MDIQEAIQKIEDHIVKGQTEKAIAVLVEYTKASKSTVHEDAVLLSGQFRQWKRESMLGVQQSGSELRRIEMGVMSLLKSINQPNATAAPAAQPSAVTHQTAAPTKSKNLLIIVGIVSLFAIIAIVGMMMGGENTDTPTSPIDNPDTGTSIVVPPGVSILPIETNTSLIVDKTYLTTNALFYLIFQTDGNLVVYKTADGSFQWGSVQSGGPESFVASTAAFQGDGSLVLHNKKGNQLWGTQATKPDALLGVSSSGLPVIFDKSGHILWEGHMVPVEDEMPCADPELYAIHPSASLSKGDQLNINECLISSNQQYALVVGADNLQIIELSGTIAEGSNNFAMVCGGDDIIWSPNELYNWNVDRNSSNFRMGTDCNLCFDNNNNMSWCATNGGDNNKGLLNNCSNAMLTDDGRLVVINNQGVEVWSSK